MKRVFTLMLTLMFALVISAATGVKPQKGSKFKAVPFQKSLTIQSAKTAQAQKVAKTHNLKTSESQNLRTSKLQTFKTTKPQNLKTSKPRKSENETINLTVSNPYTFEHYDATENIPTGDWYFGASDDTGNYVIRLDYLRTEEEKYGTFTLEDLDPNYSYLTDYTGDDKAGYYYEEGTTFTVSQKDGHDVVEGTLVCDNGITYTFHAEFIPKEIHVEGTELLTARFFEEDNDWFIRFQDENYKITLDLVSPDGSFDGTYTENEALIDYCYATNLSSSTAETFKTFNVTTSLVEGSTNPEKGCEITGTALGEKGDTYTFHIYVNPPLAPTDSVDVAVDVKTAEWPTAREGYGSCYFELTETANPQMQWNLALDALQGELDESSINECSALINTETNDTLTVDHGFVTETFDPATFTLSVKADLVMSNAIDYRFSFDYQVETAGDVEYNFTNLSVDDSFYDWIGIQWIQASNDDVTFQLTVQGDIPGEYDDDTAYATLQFPNADGTYSKVDGITLFNASTTLDDSNNPVLNCKFLATDKKIYTVNAHFEVPEPTDTINVNIDGLKINDLIDDMGAFQIYGYNNDSTMYVSLAPEASEIPGHYTMADLETYSDYCYLVFINKENGSYEQNAIYAADFDVTQDDRFVTVTGKFQAGAHIVNMTLQGTITVNGLDYDNEDTDIDVNFDPEDLAELVKYEDQGYAYVRLQNTERNDMFAMLIYLDTFDDDICFPEGTYEINDSYQVNTVQHGSFSSDYSTVYPTFYSTCDEQGYLNLPLWLLQTGTATISKTTDNQIALEVYGQNSWERNVHVAYNIKSDGIKTLDAANTSVKKLIENQQIVIKKGDKKYTVSGQTVK